MRAAHAAAAAVLAAAVLLAGCSSHTSGTGTSAARSTTPAPTSSAATTCPTSYVPPDPARPRVRLDFTVAPDLASVHGSEHVEFTPDARITELVFRLTANSPPTVEAGNGIRVTAASADHGAGAPTYSASGAAPATQGGLLHLPFASPVPAGTTVRADLSFDVTLGRNSFDRFGRSGSGRDTYAWFGSAQPLLAWERGYGWHTEPMSALAAETATSEAMATDLTVTAPAADTVLMSGTPRAATDAGAGTRRWHATLDAARDVSVAAGPFAVSDTTVDGTALRVGGTSTSDRDTVVAQERRAITELSRRFGPFPFPSLSVASLPGDGGGIEYPGSVLLLLHGATDAQDQVVDVHETAHQWFYAMVGNSQASHPWLDEAFASYGEQLVDGDPPSPAVLDDPGPVDASTESYGSDERRYTEITYDKGAAALHAARNAAGAAAFDAAVRCYVNANAWRVADPSDLATALKDLPAATAALTRAGALP